MDKFPPQPTQFGPQLHYGVMGAPWGRSEGWKPPKVGGCTSEKSPGYRELGRPAQRMTIDRIRSRAAPPRLDGCKRVPEGRTEAKKWVLGRASVGGHW